MYYYWDFEEMKLFSVLLVGILKELNGLEASLLWEITLMLKAVWPFHNIRIRRVHFKIGHLDYI